MPSFRALLSFVILAALGGCGASLPASVRAEMAKTPPGQVTVVEFTDFECPFCRRQHVAAAKAIAAHAGSVRIVRRQVPLSFHPHAEPAARVYLCAEEQGARVDELAEVFYTSPPAELALEPGIATAVRFGADESKMRACVNDEHITTRLRADGRAFAEANGEGVPLTYVGKTRLDGAVDAETFKSVLDAELENAGANNTPAPKTATGPASAAPPPSTSVLPFVEDDYPRALAEAKARKVPLFVDAWAPWCHSCLSMREYTFTDRSLMPLAKDFVFLSLDTEKESNAPFVRKFPNEVWPTLYVIDPTEERADVKWGGTATALELTELLSSARSGAGDGPEARAQQAFASGNRAAAAGDLEKAEASYRAALSMSGTDPKGSDARMSRDRARVVEGLTGNLSEREKWADCVTLATSELPRMPRGSSRATVLATAVECADEGKDEAKERALLDLIRADLAAPDDGSMLADDRSSLYDTLTSAEEKSPDTKEQAKKDGEAWAAFLEAQAKAAKTKEARAVFDPHRLLAYTAAGRERDAIPMLEQSLRDFPADYNPKARLAKVYFDTKDFARARSYVDGAFAQVYGPRTLRVAALGASIAKAQGKPEEAKAFLESALARCRNLPLTAKQRKLFESTERDLQKSP